MKISKNVFKDTSNFEIVTLSALVTFLAAFAMLGAYLHHHAGFVVHPDCPICGFGDILSSGDKTAVYAMPGPDSSYVSLDTEEVIRIPLIVTPADSTRAPPFK